MQSMLFFPRAILIELQLLLLILAILLGGIIPALALRALQGN
jgi:hypothetical protein